MNHFILPLAGLHCMGCARKVEHQLEANLNIQILQLSPTQIELETDASIEAVIEQIEQLGFQSGRKQSYQLQGLHCGQCVQKLSALLEASEHITDLQVTQDTLSLISTLSMQDIQAQVASLGFTAIPQVTKSSNDQPQEHLIPPTRLPPSPSKPRINLSTIPDKNSDTSTEEETTHLLIQGMTCASCVASVEKAILSVAGVQSAQVNLAEQSATVYTATSSDIPQLMSAIQSAGYHAEYIDNLAHQQEKQRRLHHVTVKRHQRNAILGLLLGAPMMLWGIWGGSMVIHSPSDQIGWGIIGLLCLALLCTAGQSFYQNAWQSLQHRRATMDTLVALGTGAAWLYSIMVVFFPQWFPEQARHVYFEASAMIIGLISLGHAIEAKAKAKTTQSLQALINLQPQTATWVSDIGDQAIQVDQIQKGMSLRIKPGDKLPVDGIVLNGESYLNEAMLTGEPIPVYKSQGSPVSAGTINHDGRLIIQATGVGRDTMLARIIQMVRRAQGSKPPIAKMADQIASVFVPTVVLIALLAALIWFWFGPAPKISHMLVVATTVLIIACPCALGLATPLSVTVGIGKAAEMGILIRDAEVLQTASHIDTVVFDKTGTLTEGNPRVQHIESLTIDLSELLPMIYALEQQSNHPLAKAICEYAAAQHITPVGIDNFENLTGRGLKATYQGKAIHIGSIPHMHTAGISLEPLQTAIKSIESQVWTPIVIALDNQVEGIIAISDPIKPDAIQAIQSLNELGIKTVMLTGDHHSVANAIAKTLGIQTVFSQILPDEKAQHILKLQQQGHHVAMLGDGINDAPALAQADLGIAMGNGSDVAIESAQITFLHSSPLAIINTIRLSKAVIKNMKQNLLGAFIYNTLGIPIAAGALYPAFGFLLNPVIAGAAMALSSITVVSNANRLHRFKAQHSPTKNKTGRENDSNLA